MTISTKISNDEERNLKELKSKVSVLEAKKNELLGEVTDEIIREGLFTSSDKNPSPRDIAFVLLKNTAAYKRIIDQVVATKK